MKKGRFSEEKIVKILQEAESVSVADLCRKHGMSDAAFYLWRQKYGGLSVTDLKRLKSLAEENRKPWKIVADQVLTINAIEDLLTKKFKRLTQSAKWCDGLRPPSSLGGIPPREAAQLRLKRETDRRHQLIAGTD